MWTPDKYEAKRAKNMLKVWKLNNYERDVMCSIVHAHQVNGCLDSIDRETLLTLECKYRCELAKYLKASDEKDSITRQLSNIMEQIEMAKEMWLDDKQQECLLMLQTASCEMKTVACKVTPVLK
ncbi:hypothetical protein HYE59_06980 [Aggregatibacter actinomycetemcomitans]|uniref:hypothetical protein n=1 Tax=Aggregatibacter actinomycetemcomitans TaxID=714 RepID=UPI00197BBA88|nr:hypothetical protein [Aggregatibacter actinomycetemcomitans]MBN6077281.1 hypothetical protein [Aggregatibacter actinomycetemcomitans]